MTVESLITDLASVPGLEQLSVQLQQSIEDISTNQALIEEKMKELATVRSKYLKKRIMENGLQEVIAQYHSKANKGSVSCEGEMEAMHHVEQSLALRDLVFRNGKSGNAFHRRDLPSDPMTSKDSRVVDSLLEEEFLHQCLNLLKVMQIDEADSFKAQMSTLQSLPELTHTELLTLKSFNDKMCKNKAVKAANQQKVEKCLVGDAETLERVAVDLRLGKQAESDQRAVEYLLKKGDTLRAKAKLLEGDVKCATYSSEAQEALQRLHSHLTTNLDEVSKKTEKMETTLRKYEEVGPDFSELLKEYERIKEDIEAKEWALKELQACGDENAA